MIGDLCIKHDTLCFSDEVYEWLIYRGHQHVKIGMLMLNRTLEVLYFREFQIFGTPRQSFRTDEIT